MQNEKIKSKIKLVITNPLSVFLIKGFVLFALWSFLIFPWLISDQIHAWMILKLVQISSCILSWFYPLVVHTSTEIFIHGKHYVHIGIPCDGIEVMGVFACIIIAFSAKWYHKAWFILVGCMITTILNIARITALTILIYNKQIRAFDINHKYVFNTVLFGVLLILFSLWTTKFAIKSVSENTR